MLENVAVDFVEPFADMHGLQLFCHPEAVILKYGHRGQIYRPYGAFREALFLQYMEIFGQDDVPYTAAVERLLAYGGDIVCDSLMFNGRRYGDVAGVIVLDDADVLVTFVVYDVLDPVHHEFIAFCGILMVRGEDGCCACDLKDR